VRSIQRGDASVVAPQEYETPCRHERSAAAAIVEALLPDDAVGLQIERRVQSTARQSRADVVAAAEGLFECGRSKLGAVLMGAVDVVVGADVHPVRSRVVG